MLSPALHRWLQQILEIPHIDHYRAVGGGSINNCYRIAIPGGRNYFLKTNDANAYPGLFEKERNGLERIAATGCIRTPKVIASGVVDAHQVLVLEWIDSGVPNTQKWEDLGRGLALQHQVRQKEFGFGEDNYIGSLPQSNAPFPHWIEFFITQRLEPQLSLARLKGRLNARMERGFAALLPRLDEIYEREDACLLHGDLWSGNVLFDSAGLPVLIDPAVYFGHRSMDIGMTMLFGEFDPMFYSAYQYYYPLPPNAKVQYEVSQLYPLLVHLNLFGAAYLEPILERLRKFS